MKKDYIISKHAKEAKLNDNSLIEDIVDDEDVLEELLVHIKFLNVLIKRSHLDELVLFLAQPYRIYPINVLLGFTKGLGFALGVLLVWCCYELFFKG